MSKVAKKSPFNSIEVFRYVDQYNQSICDQLFNRQKLSHIIHNKNFDIHVKNEQGKNILYEMCVNQFSDNDYLPDIEYLLSIPDIEVDEDFIHELESRKDKHPHDAMILEKIKFYKNI